jgi:hypothetical protein
MEARHTFAETAQVIGAVVFAENNASLGRHHLDNFSNLFYPASSAMAHPPDSIAHLKIVQHLNPSFTSCWIRENLGYSIDQLRR